jgi:uncharacterized protein YmfQ (DUF2313 family)
MRTEEQYNKVAHQIAPQGMIWPSISDNSEIGKLWATVAKSLLDADTESGSMLDESYPDSTGIFLEDWTRVLGFPRCSISDLNDQQQRDANLAWLNISPYSNKQFFIDIAAVLGYTITIEDKNDDITLGAFEFRVTSSLTAPTTIFKVGQSKVGDKLVDSGSNDPLECLINFFAPAHTVPIFVYV